MDLKRRLWLGVAEVGMAFAGLVVGYLVVGIVVSQVDVGPWLSVGGPVITGIAAYFYATVGPRWSSASLEEGEEIVAPMPRSSLGGMASAGVAVVGVVVALGGSIGLGLLLELVGLGVEEQQSVLKIAERTQDGGFSTEALALAGSALLLAPALEEWLFRRLLFVRVLATSGRFWAYGLSALCFAAIHNNPAGIVIYFWLGLVFAYVLERTGRLWAAIAVHMGNNAYVLAMLFFGGVDGGM